jgi:hypothetical protein
MMVLAGSGALASCSQAPEVAFAPGSVTAAPAVDPRAVERVAKLAHEVRGWLAERYGPPRTRVEARIVLVPDDHWLADARDAASVEAAPAFSYRPGSRHLSFGRDDPRAVLLAPCFGSYARADALARWIFYVEWTGDLPPWIREGISETVGAALASSLDPATYDRTLDHLLPPWVAGPRPPPFPQVGSLASADARDAARRYDECARVIAAATDGGEPSLVRELIVHPPRSDAEVSSFATRAQQRASRFPSLRRLVTALEERPRASSTTALVEAATPPSGIAPEEVPEAFRDPSLLEDEFVALARSARPDVRRMAVFGLGRLATPRARALILAASRDESASVRATALVARARSGDRDAASGLLDLARDAPIEEAPGNVALVLELFDRLTGYRDEPGSAPDEVSLASVLGARHASTLRPRFRDIERRASWLAAASRALKGER